MCFHRHTKIRAYKSYNSSAQSMLDGVVRKIFGTQSRALSLSSQKATYIPVASNIQVITKRPTWLRDGLITCGRGVKSKATFQLQDLPQGVLKNDVETPAERDEAPTYPTVIQQARNNMRKFENSVLLTRVGGFYEVCYAKISHESFADTLPALF